MNAKQEAYFTVYNDLFTVTCHWRGRTVQVFHRATGEELARFKDMPHAYRASLNPKRPAQLLVKSTTPKIAFYCLQTLSLQKIIRIKHKGAYTQDGGICFTHDGRYLLNIESSLRKVNGITTGICTLVKYDCDALEEVDRYFINDSYYFRIIERHESGYLLFGYEGITNSGDKIYTFDGEKITGGKRIKPINSIHPKDHISAYAEIYYQ